MSKEHGAVGFRHPQMADVIFVHIDGHEMNMTVRPKIARRPLAECYNGNGKMDLDEVLWHLAARCKPELDYLRTERKHVVDQSWVKACLKARYSLHFDYMGGYEIRYTLFPIFQQPRTIVDCML